MDWRDEGIRVSYQIKRKEERKRRAAGKKKKTPRFSLIPNLCSHLFSLLLFR